MQTPLSYLEIDTEALRANVRALRAELKGGQKVAGVIKANAYGHGDTLVAKALEAEVDYFQIDDIEEWRRIRPVTNRPLLVLGYVQEFELLEIIGTNTEIGIFSFDQLANVNKLAEKAGVVQSVHIPFDCLLGREGFMPSEVREVIAAIRACANVRLAGVYAHFANVEDTTDPSHAKAQVETLRGIVNAFNDAGFTEFHIHHSSTAGTMIFEDTGDSFCTLVRLGIGIYGYWPAVHLSHLSHLSNLELRPALRWITHIATIKTLPENHTVGYGLTHRTDHETKIALIPQGYSDGYDRRGSNIMAVLIGGTRCAVLGRVSMNKLVADVTHLKDVRIGDEVVLIGEQGKANMTATEFGASLGTIDYEILARLSPLLPRIAK